MKVFNKPDNSKFIIILSAGKPPIGSWHQRIKMFNLGFKEHNYELIHLVPYYPPTHEAKSISPSYINYCLKPVKNRKRNLLTPLVACIGMVKAVLILLRLDNIKFILVPGLNFVQGFAALLVAKRKKIPLYAEIADENTHIYREGKSKAFIDFIAKYNQIAYEKYILERADKIYVFSTYLLDKYNRMFPEHKDIQLTVPSLIDIDYFDLLTKNSINGIHQDNIELLNSNYPKIVYAGACNRPNGLFFFLDAAAKIKKVNGIKFYIFFFFVYGDVDKVKQYCEELDLNENVFFFMPVESKMIPAIYSKADILLLPEQGNIIANAGFPGKTSELLASGKAILATEFSDLKLYLKNEINAMITPIGDFDQYSSNLLRLLNEPELRKSIGLQARNTAQEYFDAKKGVYKYLL